MCFLARLAGSQVRREGGCPRGVEPNWEVSIDRDHCERLRSRLQNLEFCPLRAASVGTVINYQSFFREQGHRCLPQ